MSVKHVNPEMLILARESRGLTQADLAQKTGIGQSVLSKYENGMIDVSGQALSEIAKILEYPETLFTCSEPILGFGSSCMHYRKRQALSVQDLKQIQAQINLIRIQFKRLLRSVEIDATQEFPRYDIGDYKDAETIAKFVRASWNLPIGPIKNLVATIENAGGIVFPLHFKTQKLDAVSQWPQGMPPLFFINMNMPWDRIRFSLAHEIGHLIMHTYPTDNLEEEADSFASAFLMPAREIETDLINITLPKAMQLKPYWRVSMQALIRRAYNLRRITESQYRRLFTQIGKQGYRKCEPSPISPEEPETYQRLIDIHLKEFNYSIMDLSKLLDLYQREFEKEYIFKRGAISIVK